MSYKVTAWVLEHSGARLADRLVLLALAEYAHDDGTNAFPSVATLARKANISERQARYSLRSLEAAGSIAPAGSSAAGTTVYTVVTGPPAKFAPPAESGTNRSDSAPDPLEPPITFGETATALGENSNGNGPHPRSAVVARTRGPRITHNRRPVPEAELEIALAILAAFNAAAGTRQAAFTKAGRPSQGLSRILTAIADYPDVKELGPRMIAAAFRDPYWQGRPQPGNVFGPGVVQRYIDEARLGPPAANPALARFQADAEAGVIDSTATERTA